ncbi:MAG: YeeE/YedE family protein [Amphiplicatus sp.]
MRGTAAALSAGLVFGLGLVISGMFNPAKIISFLDVAGAWDPSLLLVMVSALATTFVGYRLTMLRSAPMFETQFNLPVATAIDSKLIIGAGLFGIGWGLSGLCPGPAVTGAALGDIEPYAFLAAMLAGMAARRFI